MEDNLLVIVPSRTRPHNVEDLWEQWTKVTDTAHLCVALDEDDADNYPRIDGIIYEVNPRIRMLPTLNVVASKYANEYRFLGFMGDDHRPRSKSWDTLMMNAIDGMGCTGVVYGNDLFQGERLATAAVMTSNMVRAMGYMVPPCLIHMYADNFWMDIGRSVDRLEYIHNIIIEHMHFGVGKAEVDDLYRETNFTSLMDEDRQRYEEYLATDFIDDVEKVRALL